MFDKMSKRSKKDNREKQPFAVWSAHTRNRTMPESISRCHKHFESSANRRRLCTYKNDGIEMKMQFLKRNKLVFRVYTTLSCVAHTSQTHLDITFWLSPRTTWTNDNLVVILQIQFKQKWRKIFVVDAANLWVILLCSLPQTENKSINTQLTLH